MSNTIEQPPGIEVEKEPRPLNFSWVTIGNGYRRKEGIGLTSDTEKSCAYVVFASPLPEEITDTEKAILQRYVDSNGQEYWYCGFGQFSLDEAVVMEPNKQPSLTHFREGELKHEKETPLAITEDEVAAIIKRGRTIIYTGAGISIAAGTPDMKGLMAYLGIDRSRRVDDFAQAMMFSPEGMRARLLALQSSFFERTTPAHVSLARIQRLTGVKIVTENLDMLGEVAGQVLIKRGEIDNSLPDEILEQVDYIITVGLRADDSGLLWRYRHTNPKGRFIALNIDPPPYLSNTDYYLEGDAQKTLPRLEQLLTP